MTDKRFIEQFEENVQKYPDKVILRDEHHSLTFRELDELSGRVYAYLKEKGIGRENVVMVSMPRGIDTFAAMLGVWKVGAAVAPVEDHTQEEKIEYIYKDSNSLLRIDGTLWSNIITYHSITGYKTTNAHDAALILYTSGSEGKPKGIIHEYGKLEFAANSWTCEGKSIFLESDRLSMSYTITSISGVASLLMGLYNRVEIEIPSWNDIRSIQSLHQYFIEHKITAAGVPPVYVERQDLKTPYFRLMMVGAGMANNIFSEDVIIVNGWGQTEGCAMTCTFRLDKRYPNTPIGKPTINAEVRLLEDEIEVKQGEIGEFCYRNPYTRGYINSNSTNTRNEEWFHSGDLARQLPDGNYIIVGRKTDMIKINGNRIEPAEIEAAVKKVLGIDWAFAKGFVEPERSFIVVYYTAQIDIDYARTRDELMKILPTYMIPSYFVHLDEIPYLTDGKIDRQALKAPEIDQYRAEYVAPENELEERLCTEMEKVLDTERISVNDDFYLLGGDSLRTIELVTNLGIENLTVTDIYAARTPRAIAERWMRKMIE